MPFKSKAQAGFFFSQQGKPGGPPAGSAQQWQAETPTSKKLPQRVDKKRASGITGSGRSTSRKSSPSTPSTPSTASNSISAPMKTGIAGRLPDFTADITKRKTGSRNVAAARPLTLPRAAGNRYARRGVPRSQMRSYGRTS